MGQPPPPSAPAQPPTPPVQPAGWYHDGVAQRWWDGRVWGPYAPGAVVDSNDKMLSMFAHAGVLFGGFILPLVFYVISDDEQRPETRWHAREALNFQITFIIVYFGSFVIFFGGFGIARLVDPSAGAGAAIGFGLSFVAFFAVVFGSIIANFVFSAIGAVKANSGIRWKYPIRIQFLKPTATS